MGVGWTQDDHRPRRPVTARRQTLREAERFAWRLSVYCLSGFFAGVVLFYLLNEYSF